VTFLFDGPGTSCANAIGLPARRITVATAVIRCEGGFCMIRTPSVD